MSWAILEYETGRHTELPNSICRLGFACLIPMVEDFSKKDKRKVTRPALPKLLFVPAVEQHVRLILDRIRYAEKVWRDHHGQLITIPEREIQDFMDRLDKREKKAKAIKQSVNLGAAAEKDWFGLYASLYGQQAAIKRFGRDVNEREVA